MEPYKQERKLTLARFGKANKQTKICITRSEEVQHTGSHWFPPEVHQTGISNQPGSHKTASLIYVKYKNLEN